MLSRLSGKLTKGLFSSSEGFTLHRWVPHVGTASTKSFGFKWPSQGYPYSTRGSTNTPPSSLFHTSIHYAQAAFGVVVAYVCLTEQMLYIPPEHREEVKRLISNSQ